MALVTEIGTNILLQSAEVQGEVLESYTNVNQQHRIDKIQCEGIVLYRYILVTTYLDYDVIKSERFFSSRDKALCYWRKIMKDRLYYS